MTAATVRLRRNEPMRPADVSPHLTAALLARENALEDVNYSRIVPNDFIVELNEDNYQRRYRPIEERICRQWRERLLAALNTANDRQGRKESSFAGPVRIQIRPAADLAENEARITCEVVAEQAAPAPALTGCLQSLPGGQQWPLREGVVTIGRDPGCDIPVSDPLVHEKRLVSGWHAHLVCRPRQVLLFDGSPDGKSSANGTYVNGRRVPPEGRLLHEGDLILLAALDPADPRTDTPGVATFVFRAECG